MKKLVGILGLMIFQVMMLYGAVPEQLMSRFVSIGASRGEIEAMSQGSNGLSDGDWTRLANLNLSSEALTEFVDKAQERNNPKAALQFIENKYARQAPQAIQQQQQAQIAAAQEQQRRAQSTAAAQPTTSTARTPSSTSSTTSTSRSVAASPTATVTRLPQTQASSSSSSSSDEDEGEDADLRRAMALSLQTQPSATSSSSSTSKEARDREEEEEVTGEEPEESEDAQLQQALAESLKPQAKPTASSTSATQSYSTSSAMPTSAVSSSSALPTARSTSAAKTGKDDQQKADQAADAKLKQEVDALVKQFDTLKANFAKFVDSLKVTGSSGSFNYYRDIFEGPSEDNKRDNQIDALKRKLISNGQQGVASCRNIQAIISLALFYHANNEYDRVMAKAYKDADEAYTKLLYKLLVHISILKMQMQIDGEQFSSRKTFAEKILEKAVVCHKECIMPIAQFKAVIIKRMFLLNKVDGEFRLRVERKNLAVGGKALLGGKIFDDMSSSAGTIIKHIAEMEDQDFYPPAVTRPFKVTFANEDGIDAGGLRREFMGLFMGPYFSALEKDSDGNDAISQWFFTHDKDLTYALPVDLSLPQYKNYISKYQMAFKALGRAVFLSLANDLPILLPLSTSSFLALFGNIPSASKNEPSPLLVRLLFEYSPSLCSNSLEPVAVYEKACQDQKQTKKDPKSFLAAYFETILKKKITVPLEDPKSALGFYFKEVLGNETQDPFVEANSTLLENLHLLETNGRKESSSLKAMRQGLTIPEAIVATEAEQANVTSSKDELRQVAAFLIKGTTLTEPTFITGLSGKLSPSVACMHISQGWYWLTPDDCVYGLFTSEINVDDLIKGLQPSYGSDYRPLSKDNKAAAELFFTAVNEYLKSLKPDKSDTAQQKMKKQDALGDFIQFFCGARAYDGRKIGLKFEEGGDPSTPYGAHTCFSWANIYISTVIDICTPKNKIDDATKFKQAVKENITSMWKGGGYTQG